MHKDAEIAIRALDDGADAWVRLIPEVIEDLGGRTSGNGLLNAVAAFESVKVAAGEEATRWLREIALDSYDETVTHLFLRNRAIEGFYALSSTEVVITRPPGPEQDAQAGQPAVVLHRRQPASRIVWIAKSCRATADGNLLLQHALSTAIYVGEYQATKALVIDAYDEPSANLWEKRGFHRSTEQPGADGLICLWKPLQSPTATEPSEPRKLLGEIGDALRSLRRTE